LCRSLARRYCALKAAKQLKKGQKCVVVLADSVRNYMTKALSDDWMIDNGFADNDIIKAKTFSQHWWDQKKVCELDIKTPLTITNSVTVRDAIALLKREGFDMVPVLSDDGSILGVATEGNMTAKLLSGRVQSTDPVSKVLYKTFKKVNMGDNLGMLAGIFDHEPFALVTTEQRIYSAGPDGGKTIKTKSVVSGIVSRIDLLDFISAGEAK
jgi:cystathionine beta-synthase